MAVFPPGVGVWLAARQGTIIAQSDWLP